MKSFDDIYAEREKNNKIINKGNKNITLSKEDIIYDNYLVNSIKEIKSNTSLESIINRFEKIDRQYELISLEERFLDKEIQKNERNNRIVQYLSEKNKKFSLEVSIPYLDYMNKGYHKLYKDMKDDKIDVKNTILVFLQNLGNTIINIINMIIKLINVGIHFVLTLVQFITTQFFKLLASKSIPQQEFDIKMARLKQNSFKKNIKTRYQMNVSEIVIEGMKNFSKFGIMTEGRYKWLLDQYEDMIKKSGYDKGEIDLTSGTIDTKAAVLLYPYMNELYNEITGSLEKDFIENSLKNYSDSYAAKSLKLKVKTIHNRNELTISEKMGSFDANTIQQMAKESVKVIFGKKEKAEPIDVLEFFRNNSGIITDSKAKQLQTFIDACKQSVKNYKEFEKQLKIRSAKLDFGKTPDEINNGNENIKKIELYCLMFMYKNIINPFTRFTCSYINYTRRGFVLEFYKLKSFMLSLWNKATFYKDGEEPDFESANMDEGDIETPQEVLRIAEIPAVR